VKIDAAPLLVAKNIAFAYRDGMPVLHGIDLTIGERDAVGIVGESGCGKTTLATVISGLRVPTSGSVTLRGTPWADIKRQSPLGRSVQMIFQNPYTALNPRLTAERTVAEVYSVCQRLDRTHATEAARKILRQVGIDGQALSKKPQHLSGGQCQRVGIARALATDPAVLIADEPTSALDVSVQAQILNLILDLTAERNLALILISHDLSVVSYLTNRIVVMDSGRIVEHGLTQQILRTPQHPCTRALLRAVI
jgi:ABC-type dipeptide/oligopeptide/nickel transport system ATPase subunit